MQSHIYLCVLHYMYIVYELYIYIYIYIYIYKKDVVNILFFLMIFYFSKNGYWNVFTIYSK